MLDCSKESMFISLKGQCHEFVYPRFFTSLTFNMSIRGPNRLFSFAKNVGG